MHLAAKALLDETLVRYTVKSPPVNLLIRGNVWKNTRSPTETRNAKIENRHPPIRATKAGKVKMENGHLQVPRDRRWKRENGKWVPPHPGRFVIPRLPLGTREFESKGLGAYGTWKNLRKNGGW